MKKVLLVRPPSQRLSHGRWPPFGLAYIASYLHQHSVDVSIKAVDYGLDQFSPDEWQKQLQNYQPGVVGISILMLNAMNGLKLAQLCKEVDPNITVVMGGVQATLFPHDCLENSDIVVRGEGEETFFEIVSGVPKESIQGISFKRDGQIIDTPPRTPIADLDKLPFPLLSLFEMERYLGNGNPRTGMVLGSRGCPYGCTFCASQLFWGRSIRFRSAKNIVDEIELIQEKYQLEEVGFGDDTLNIPLSRGIEICDEIISRNLPNKLQFGTLLRANKATVSAELFQKMKKANFVGIGFGIESASPRVLKAMKKSLNMQEVSNAVKLAHDSGIPSVTGNFMVGNWDESLTDVFKTWWFVLTHNVDTLFWICTPYPGTEFSKRLLDAGYLKDTPFWWAKIRPGVYTPVARTNKMSKFTISAVYFVSISLQVSLYLFRAKNFKKFIFFGKRALIETFRKILPGPA